MKDFYVALSCVVVMGSISRLSQGIGDIESAFWILVGGLNLAVALFLSK